jgi:glycosyltransferase involved in cell wall biosynthesis
MNHQPAKPFVSIVIPAYNSAPTLGACLRAIREQTYPPDRIEIIVADAGSQDATVEIARSFKATAIVPNPLQTGEAGKATGLKAARGEILALVDSDNILDSPDWLERMLAPFADPAIVAAEPLYYTRRDADPALTRYFAMLGMNDPLCLFLGNYDRYSLVTGRWTDLRVGAEDKGDYLALTLSADRLPTIGANGFVFRRELLAQVRWEPYFFDIDIMHQAVAAGFTRMAKVKCGIVHLFCSRLRDFARKQDRRVKDFLYFADAKGRSYPWDRQKKAGIVRFCVATVLLVPLALQMLRGWRRKPDRAWLYHLPACWITLWVYGVAALRKLLGYKPEIKSRAGWQKAG